MKGGYRKTVLEHKRPKFTIIADTLQWVLKTDGNTYYFPTLGLLLCELTEVTLRKQPKKLKEIKELNASLDKVFDLISSVAKDLNKLGKKSFEESTVL